MNMACSDFKIIPMKKGCTNFNSFLIVFWAVPTPTVLIFKLLHSILVCHPQGLFASKSTRMIINVICYNSQSRGLLYWITWRNLLSPHWISFWHWMNSAIHKRVHICQYLVIILVFFTTWAVFLGSPSKTSRVMFPPKIYSHNKSTEAAHLLGLYLSRLMWFPHESFWSNF